MTALALAFTAANVYADPTPTQLPGAGLIRAVNTGTTISSPSNFYLVSGGGGVGGQITTARRARRTSRAAIQLENAGDGSARGDPLGRQQWLVRDVQPGRLQRRPERDVLLHVGSVGDERGSAEHRRVGQPVADLRQADRHQRHQAGHGRSRCLAWAAVRRRRSSWPTPTASSWVPLGQVQSPTGVALIGANLNNNTAIVRVHGQQRRGRVVPGRDGLAVEGGRARLHRRRRQRVQPAGGVCAAGRQRRGEQRQHLRQKVTIMAGMRGYASTTASDTVNGVSKVSVQRLFNVDTGGTWRCLLRNARHRRHASRSRTRARRSSTPARCNRRARGGFLNILAAKGFRNGVLGDPNPLVGVFSDNGLRTNVYEAGGMTELYSVIAGYSTGIDLPYLSGEPGAGLGWRRDAASADARLRAVEHHDHVRRRCRASAA